MFRVSILFFTLLFADRLWAEELRVTMRDRGDLAFELPAGWRGKVRFLEPIPFPEATVRNEDGSLQILIVGIWPAPSGKPPTAEGLRETTNQTIEVIRPRAVEREIVIHDLGAPGKIGCYFSATDRAPEANAFKYIISGGVIMDEFIITFTISTKEELRDAEMKALEVIRSVRRAAPQKAAEGGRK